MNTHKRRGEQGAALEKVDEGRRKFIRKVAAGTAFAIPMVASFSTDGLSFNKAEANDLFRSNQTDGGFLGGILRFLLSLFKSSRPV